MLAPTIADQVTYHKKQEEIQFTFREAEQATGIPRDELIEACRVGHLKRAGWKGTEGTIRKVDALWYFEKRNYERNKDHDIQWVRDFYRQGFAILRNVFDDTDIERLKVDQPQTMQNFIDGGGLTYGAPVYHRTTTDDRRYLERILACVGYDNLTFWMAGHPIFAKVSSDLWGTEDYCVPNYGLVYRPIGAPVIDPHRDRIWFYPPRRRVSRFLLSVYITGSDETDGGVQFLSGSHYSAGSSSSGNRDFLDPLFWDEKNYTFPCVTPYDAVIHNVATCHYVAPHYGMMDARRIFIGCVPEWDWNHPDGFNDFVTRDESLEYVETAKFAYQKHRG